MVYKLFLNHNLCDTPREQYFCWSGIVFMKLHAQFSPKTLKNILIRLVSKMSIILCQIYVGESPGRYEVNWCWFSHGAIQSLSLCDKLYTNRFGFLIQIQRFYFYGKRVNTDEDILQILKIFENRRIWKVTWRKVTVLWVQHLKFEIWPAGFGFPRVRVRVAQKKPGIPKRPWPWSRSEHIH
jgi:hypothetical protein